MKTVTMPIEEYNELVRLARDAKQNNEVLAREVEDAARAFSDLSRHPLRRPQDVLTAVVNILRSGKVPEEIIT